MDPPDPVAAEVPTQLHLTANLITWHSVANYPQRLAWRFQLLLSTTPRSISYLGHLTRTILL